MIRTSPIAPLAGNPYPDPIIPGAIAAAITGELGAAAAAVGNAEASHTSTLGRLGQTADAYDGWIADASNTYAQAGNLRMDDFAAHLAGILAKPSPGDVSRSQLPSTWQGVPTSGAWAELYPWAYGQWQNALSSHWAQIVPFYYQYIPPLG